MFGFGLDKRTLYIIIAVMAVITLASLGTSGILSLLISIPGVLIAMTFHEFAHAFVADKLGDYTPRMQGRLNLNPLSHIDPIGLICLIVAGFGWGKPVQINSRNFNGKKSTSAAEAIVAIAGPIMNFILAFIFIIIIAIIEYINPSILYSGLQITIWYEILLNIVIINLSLGVFNLIPIPPLDGSKVLNHFLPYNAKQWFYKNEQIFTIVFFLLLFIRPAGVSVISRILTPIIGGILDGFVWIVSSIFGLFL